MTPEEIPQELVDMLNRDAGKQHRRTGTALRSLAAILTRYEQIRPLKADPPSPVETSET
jgi:hypothetical protein